MRFLAGFLAVLVVGAPVWADSLVHNGKTYSNVFVREGNSSYYIQDPATGNVTALPKSEVSDVTISSDKALRESLLKQWKAANLSGNGARPMPALTAVAKASNPLGRPAGPPPVEPVQPSRTRDEQDGIDVKLKNVPMRTALKATLHQKNLDYKVRDNYIYVSTPQRLRQEALEPLQTRYFALRNSTATMPKIVVRNPGGSGYPQTYGNNYGGGMQGGGMYGGGMQGGGMYGGGMQGGGMYGGGMYGGGGMMGGGMMGGGMGRGGGMMGGYGGAQHFSNISDLFFNIDDRLVGETPAVIGIGGISTGPSGPPR